MNIIKTYAGLLECKDYEEGDNILFLSGEDEPLADELSWMSGRSVSVRYWVSDKICTREEANDAFLRTCMGDAAVQYQVAYSELTGYLWTDEELMIGGHDLLKELKSSKGRWCILEVEYGA